MEYHTKRKLTFGVIFVWMFANGVEYAVIFPTIWEYLQSLGTPSGDVYYLGLCISGSVMSDIFSGLLIGWIVDSNKCSVSKILLILNLFLITSNLLYFVASSPSMVFISRLICGLGSSASIALLTDVTKVSTTEERTPLILTFNITYQIGLLIGPACNFFLRHFEFEFGSFIVNKLNAPGFFMAIVYILYQFAIFLCYYDLSVDNEDQTLNIQENPSLRIYGQEILQPEIISLTFLRLMATFGQICLETIATPFMKVYFNYGDVENSFLFLFAGLESILVFGLLSILSKKISDRNLISFGIVIHLITYLFGVVTFPTFKTNDASNLPYFVIFCVLDLISIPILLDISLALSTKLLRQEVQGFVNGVRRFVTKISLLLGPLWGSSCLPWITILLLVPLIFNVIASVIFFASYKTMKTRPEESHEEEEQPNEYSPLLSQSRD